jgi:hypothetical protein
MAVLNRSPLTETRPAVTTSDTRASPTSSFPSLRLTLGAGADEYRDGAVQVPGRYQESPTPRYGSCELGKVGIGHLSVTHYNSISTSAKEALSEQNSWQFAVLTALSAPRIEQDFVV